MGRSHGNETRRRYRRQDFRCLEAHGRGLRVRYLLLRRLNDHGRSNRISGAVPERFLKQPADVHLLLSGLAAFCKNPVPGDGSAAFDREIPAADVWCCHEDLLRPVHRRGPGKYCDRIRYALRCKKGRGKHGFLL